MVVSLKKHFASANRSFESCMLKYPQDLKDAERLIQQINQLHCVSSDSKILEIGAAQGAYVIALQALGYSCEGIEPNKTAIEVSERLSKKLNVDLNIKMAVAEDLPYSNGSFDVVIALSVLEHVKDVGKVIQEVFRVLKPGGVFYFNTASALCPMQSEIRFFPCFSWYPRVIKIRIMNWAKQHKPSLVGYTETPAINWFTPWDTKRTLRNVGFHKVYCTWDILKIDQLERYKRALLRIIRSSAAMRLLADILVPYCAYVAVKGN